MAQQESRLPTKRERLELLSAIAGSTMDYIQSLMGKNYIAPVHMEMLNILFGRMDEMLGIAEGFTAKEDYEELVRFYNND